jgi:hypothetical protein
MVERAAGDVTMHEHPWITRAVSVYTNSETAIAETANRMGCGRLYGRRNRAGFSAIQRSS